MTIDEAIIEGERYVAEPCSKLHPEFTRFVELGIEALKRERECRENYPCENWLLLPGETEE